MAETKKRETKADREFWISVYVAALTGASAASSAPRQIAERSAQIADAAVETIKNRERPARAPGVSAFSV